VSGDSPIWFLYFFASDSIISSGLLLPGWLEAQPGNYLSSDRESLFQYQEERRWREKMEKWSDIWA